MTRRHRLSTKLTAAVVLGAALAASPGVAEAIELTGMGGMGINFWFMDVTLTPTSHRGVGVGVTGRVHLKVGRFFRVQVGLVQGRFTEDDESHVKRNLIYGALEGVHHFGRRLYLTGGLRVGGDHLDMIETLERLDGGERRILDVDRWGVTWEPFLTLGLRLAQKYHFELENGVAFSFLDGRIHASYIVTFGIFFRMGGSGSG